MADIKVADNPRDQLEDQNALWGPYWSDDQTAVIIFANNVEDASFARTEDGGETWDITVIEIGNVMHMAVWYDKETPGDSGTLVHVTWMDRIAGAVKYVTVDVSDGSVGTIRIVDGTITAQSAPSQNRITITKTVNGNIIIAFLTFTERGCIKSADGFATAGTVISNVYEVVSDMDWVLLFPADVDTGDACALYVNRNTNSISLKMYDDSANSWTETAIAAMNWDDIYMGMDGAIRHSDGHLLLAFHSAWANASDDLRTYDLTVNSIASPTVTAKTDVFTDQGESAQVSVFINQQTDDVYIAYLKGGTWEAIVDVVFHISGDGMANWGAEQAYSESVADDFRLVQAGRTVGTAGGRYQPSFYDDDQWDIYINKNNDIGFAPAVIDLGWFVAPPDVILSLHQVEPGLHALVEFSVPADTFLDIPSVVITTNVQRLPDKVVGY